MVNQLLVLHPHSHTHPKSYTPGPPLALSLRSWQLAKVLQMPWVTMWYHHCSVSCEVKSERFCVCCCCCWGFKRNNARAGVCFGQVAEGGVLSHVKLPHPTCCPH